MHQIAFFIFIKLLHTAFITFNSLSPLSGRMFLKFRFLKLILLFSSDNRPSFPAFHCLYNSCFSEIHVIDQVIFLRLADFVNLEVVYDFIRTHISFVTAICGLGVAWLHHVLSDTADVLLTFNVIALRTSVGNLTVSCSLEGAFVFLLIFHIVHERLFLRLVTSHTVNVLTHR